MELVIPDGVPVFITVGHSSPMMLPYEPPAGASRPAGQGGRVVKTFLAGLLLVGVFQAGRFLPHRSDSAAAAQAVATAAPSPVTGTSAAGDIPPAFRAQMAQPPQVVPPPGTPAVVPGQPGNDGSIPPAKTPPPNPFGLQG
jgi:hypothetical protein